jgi:hypothetical protein
MKSCIKTLPLIAVLSLALLVGCSKNSTEPLPPTTAQGWLDLAWLQYEAGDYNGASTSVTNGYLIAKADSLVAYQDSVLAVNNGDSLLLQNAMQRLETVRAEYIQGYTCGGWLGTGGGNPEQGNANFSAALAIDPTYTDASGGNCFALQIMGNWTQSNEMAVATMAQNPAWEFTHNHQINHLDLRLARVENYFNMGEFETSLELALDLNNNYGLPTTPRQASEFNLATIEGRAALAQLINTLDGLI